MRGSLTVTYSRIVGGTLIALAAMLGGCVGQVDEVEEMLDESGEALQVDQDEGTDRIDSSSLRTVPIVENTEPDPDPQPWRPLAAVDPAPRQGKMR